MSERVEEIPPAESDGELVHWMAPKPLALGPAGVSAAALGGFALGALLTLAALSLADMLGGGDEDEAPRGRRR